MRLFQQLIRAVFIAALALAFPVCRSFELWLLEGAFTLQSAVKFNSSTLGACVSIKTCFDNRAHWAVWMKIADGEQIVFYDDVACTGKSVATPTATNGNLNFFDEAVGMAGEVSAFKTWKKGMLESPTSIAPYSSSPESTIEKLLSIQPERLILSSECK